MVFYPAGFHNSYPRYVKYPLENIEFLRMANFNIAGEGKGNEREKRPFQFSASTSPFPMLISRDPTFPLMFGTNVRKFVVQMLNDHQT